MQITWLNKTFKDRPSKIPKYRKPVCQRDKKVKTIYTYKYKFKYLK